MIRFLVTGAPRSTTNWTAKAFTAAGLPCHHEYACSKWTSTYGDDGEWMHAPPCGEASAQAAPFTPLMRDAGVRVIHVVREPLACVASIIGWGLLSDDDTIPIHGFIQAHAGDLWDEYPRIEDRALAFWTRWNQMIESDVRVRAPITGQGIRWLAARWWGIHTTGNGLPPPSNRGVPVDVAETDFDPTLWLEASVLWDTICA